MTNYIHFDQRKYKYLFYAFSRNHYYEWSNTKCDSCEVKGYKHNPFMKNCETASEIMEQVHISLQQCNVITADRDMICYNWGYDCRTVLLRCLKLKLNIYQREKLLNKLNQTIKTLIYKDIAKFDKQEQEVKPRTIIITDNNDQQVQSQKSWMSWGDGNVSILRSSS